VENELPATVVEISDERDTCSDFINDIHILCHNAVFAETLKYAFTEVIIPDSPDYSSAMPKTNNLVSKYGWRTARERTDELPRLIKWHINIWAHHLSKHFTYGNNLHPNSPP
jgi:hypothetical protein